MKLTPTQGPFSTISFGTFCITKPTRDTKVNETTVDEVHHYYTQAIGITIVVAYHIIAFLIMHNMLIGYFAKTMIKNFERCRTSLEV